MVVEIKYEPLYYISNKLLLRLFLKGCFPLGGIFRAERNFSLSCDFSGGTNEITKKNSAPRAKFRLVESRLKAHFHGQKISMDRKFPWTENFPKIKVENFFPTENLCRPIVQSICDQRSRKLQ